VCFKVLKSSLKFFLRGQKKRTKMCVVICFFLLFFVLANLY